MDPVALVVAALVAGAAAGTTNVVSTAVMDAYSALKTLVASRLRRAGVTDEDGGQIMSQAHDHASMREALEQKLTETGVDDPTVEAAQKLLELLEQQKGKFVVDASQAKGLIVGDHATQHNTFN